MRRDLPMTSRRLRAAIWTAAAMSLAAACLAALPGSALAARPAYAPPADIQAVTLSGDTPAAIWYFPRDTARVTREVYAWLRRAAPTQAPVFPHADGAMVMDYLGPARLSFALPGGGRVQVYPAYALVAGKGHSVDVRYAPGVLAYVESMGRGPGRTLYIRERALDRYLRDDAAWHAQFQPESFTAGQAGAVARVLASRFGRPLRGFPAQPGTAALTLPARAGGNVFATATSQARTAGGTVRVEFQESWADGARQHVWRFAVRGRAVALVSQSGPMPPGAGVSP